MFGVNFNLMARKKILWLCSWYPSATEPFNGDFIQRHARAAALYNDIHVIHVTGDDTGTVQEITKTVHSADGLTEHIIIYKRSRSLLGKIKANYRWYFLIKQAIRKYMVEHKKPVLAHVHIPYKAAMAGMWLRSKYKVPYVLSEHWGIYNDVEVLNYSGRSRWFKKISVAAFTNAIACTSVSHFLADGVRRLVAPADFTIIPNAVDTRIFNYKENSRDTFQFIHVSNMVPLKNAEGILQAFSALIKKGVKARLLMVGNPDAKMPGYAAGLGLTEEQVQFSGEISYAAVAQKMQESHCLVLNSNIENSPCVIGEGLCCGLPVIATAVGGVPELVHEQDGLLIPSGDNAALENAMEKMIAQYTGYDRQQLSSAAAGKFSYEVIGKAFDELYERALAK